MSALLVIAAIALFLGLAGTAALIFALIYGVRRGVYALKGEPYRPLLGSGSKNTYQHQDVDAGSTSDSIASVFRHNLNVKGVAPYARSGMAALSSAERKSANYRAVLDQKFQPGSITWQKFAGADEATQQAVVRNCAELANAIQLFDYEDFSRSERARRRATYRKDAPVLQTTQIEKQSLFHTQMAEMQAICDRNDKLLLELDKLTAELQTLDDSGSSAKSDQLIEEVRTLAAETKYYRDALDDMDS